MSFSIKPEQERTESMTLHYAHCTKLTPGELDCAPFSAYEAREIYADASTIWSEEDGNEWRISIDGRILAVEKELKDAIAIAEYQLMAESREALIKPKSYPLKTCAEGELIGCFIKK